MTILIIILCLIVICLFALFANKDKDNTPISSPKISKRKLDIPKIDKESNSLLFTEGKPIGVSKNGQIYYDNGDLYITHNNRGVCINDPNKSTNLILPLLDPNRDIKFMPSQNPFEYPYTHKIGETFDIEEQFTDKLKNKIYRLFANEIYSHSHNGYDTLFYAQRCEVTSDGVIKLFTFKNQGVPFVIDPLGHKFPWLGAFKIINEEGDLIPSKIIHEPNNEQVCDEWGNIYFKGNISNLHKKIYAVWYIKLKQ